MSRKKPLLRNRLYVPASMVPGRAYSQFTYKFKRMEEERVEDSEGQLIRIDQKYLTEVHETYKEKDGVIGFHRGDLAKLRKIFPMEWKDERARPPMGAPLAMIEGFKYRHDQGERLEDMLATDGGGIQIAPTGYGKTAFGISLAVRLGLRTLVLASRTNWLDDWLKDMVKHTNYEYLEAKYGKPVCGIIDNTFKEKDLFPCINLATFQGFWSRAGLLARRDLRNAFGLIIADEASLLPANEVGKVFTSFNPGWRVGLTADETRPDGVHRLTYDYVGQIVSKGQRQDGVTGTLIREQSGVSINAMSLYGRWLGSMQSRICKNTKFTELIVKRVMEDVMDGYKVLLMTKTRDHVSKLYKLLMDQEIPIKGAPPAPPPAPTKGKKKGKKPKRDPNRWRTIVVETLMGGDKTMDDKKRRARLGEIDILVCTEVVQMNTDIDRMDCLHDIVPLKSVQTIRQRAGRVTRAHPDKLTPRVRMYSVAVGPDSHPAGRYQSSSWAAQGDWYHNQGWHVVDIDENTGQQRIVKVDKTKKISSEDYIPRK